MYSSLFVCVYCLILMNIFTGLDKAWLDSQLDDKRLGRLAVKLTKEETHKIYMCLKEREPEQSWKNLESNTKEQFALKINALHDWKKSTRHATFNKLQESMKKKNIDIHKLCQVRFYKKLSNSLSPLFYSFRVYHTIGKDVYSSCLTLFIHFIVRIRFFFSKNGRLYFKYVSVDLKLWMAYSPIFFHNVVQAKMNV